MTSSQWKSLRNQRQLVEEAYEEELQEFRGNHKSAQ